MKNHFETRFYKISLIISILIAILVIRLFVLTVFQHAHWQTEANTQSVETIYTSAPRGEILDRNGRVLATSKQVFNVTFNVSGLETEEINDSSYQLIRILEKNGEKFKDDFPIKMTSTGDFYYSFEQKTRNWLVKNGFSPKNTAEETFLALRDKYNIDPTLDRYDAFDTLEDKYDLEIPINVKKMKYTCDIDRENFLITFGWPESEAQKYISASECFKQLRKDFKIRTSLSDSAARKILCIRYKVKAQGFLKYMPVTVSKDVNRKTITYISEYSAKLPGVEVVSETERVYPNKRLASHILGYMGSISDSEMDYYVKEKGYEMTDLIGKSGIEAAFEDKLKGKDGKKVIKVNASGEYIDTISETKAQKGSDVYLTIDLVLQKEVEEALEKIVHATASGTTFVSKYANSLHANQGPKCKSGAIVVMDVKTAEVLAMASYPDFNPNAFAGGISQKAWKAVQSKNPRDSLAPTPLYSLATNCAVQPGSTFKPITSMAALKAGLNPNQSIHDGGHIDIGDRSFGCDSWNTHRGSHGSETLPVGIQNSCNYYFYCVGTGVDYNSGRSLGYKIENQDIMDMAMSFGLGEKTGIELPEVVAPIPSEKTKLQNTKVALWTYIYNNARKLFPSKIAENYEKLSANIDTICSWMKSNPSRDEIAKRLKSKTDVKENQIESLTDVIKYSYFNYASWTLGDSFNLCIGQGDNAYTPLQMARYVSTLANGGTLNKASIVKNIEREGVKVKEKGKNVGLNKKDLSYVYDGMHRVTKRGTLAGVFAGFPIQCCGKTGTAEKSGHIQPANEVSYVKSRLGSLAPGVSWSNVQKWMRKLKKDNPSLYPDNNSVVDAALIQASKGKVTQERIDSGKGTYDAFAWTICFAPKDNPEIAVVVMLPQGKYSYNAGIAARECVGAYFLNKSRSYTDIDISTKMN